MTLPDPLKDPAKHLFGNAHFQYIAGELTRGLSVVDTGSTFEYLHDGAVTGNF